MKLQTRPSRRRNTAEPNKNPKRNKRFDCGARSINSDRSGRVQERSNQQDLMDEMKPERRLRIKRMTGSYANGPEGRMTTGQRGINL